MRAVVVVGICVTFRKSRDTPSKVVVGNGWSGSCVINEVRCLFLPYFLFCAESLYALSRIV